MSVHLRQFADASACFHSGKLESAASICRKILTKHPRDADALQLMGLIAAQQGSIGGAVQWLGKAVKAAGPRMDLCANLARLLLGQGKPESAVACYLQAIECGPRNAALWLALGRLLVELRREEATKCFRQVLELPGTAPEVAEALLQLGHLQHAARDYAGAAASFEAVLLSDPRSAEACFNLGVVRTILGRQAEARDAYEQALQLRPSYAEAHNNLAILEQIQGEPKAAACHYRKAIRSRPDYKDPYYNLGMLLQDQGMPEAALPLYEELLSRYPGHADGHNNRGNALLALNRVREARASYQAAIELQRNHAEAHWNLALLYLLTGDYANGWREYDWRLLRDPAAIPDFKQPFWDGAGFTGKTLLIHAEQGLGDTIQFVRYARMAKQRGGTVFFLSPKPLAGLVSGCAGIDEVFGERAELPAFDYHAPLMSLPRILGSGGDIPSLIPYLRPERALVHQWGQVLNARCSTPHDRRIGLAWRGNSNHRNDRNRSAPDWLVERLGSPAGITFFSLQKDGRAIPGNLVPLGEELTDFSDTAAVMANLDLVVSVDTAVAHLAGALGRRAWTLLAYAPDWRWLLDRADTPWYPSMHLIRQQSRGDWEGVAARVARDLMKLAGGQSE